MCSRACLPRKTSTAIAFMGTSSGFPDRTCTVVLSTWPGCSPTTSPIRRSSSEVASSSGWACLICVSRLLADWEFNLRCMLDPSVRFRHVDVVVARYQLGGASSTRPEPTWHKERMGLLGRRFHWGTGSGSCYGRCWISWFDGRHGRGGRRPVAPATASLQRLHNDLLASPGHRLSRALIWPLNVARGVLGKRRAGVDDEVRRSETVPVSSRRPPRD